jgi:hypothetical protein
MALLSEELEQRLRKLEQEQDNQQVALNDIGDLEKEIRQLEATLATIDSYLLHSKGQKTDYSDLRDLEAIEKLEHKLEHIDEEFASKAARPAAVPPKTHSKQPVTSTPTATKTADKEITTPTPVSKTNATYLICLMFNSKAPNEWSGTGWSEQGKGMRYDDLEQAKQVFQKLRKQWPEHPIKIIKR